MTDPGEHDDDRAGDGSASRGSGAESADLGGVSAGSGAVSGGSGALSAGSRAASGSSGAASASAGMEEQPAERWKRDRSSRNRPAGGRSGVSRDERAPARGSARGVRVGWLPELLGEVVFLGLVILVSWLVYGSVRWPFVAVVFLAVNAALAVIALAVFLVRARRRR